MDDYKSLSHNSNSNSNSNSASNSARRNKVNKVGSSIATLYFHTATLLTLFLLALVFLVFSFGFGAISVPHFGARL